MYNNNISTNRITAHYILPCHTRHNRPDGDRRQTHAYPRQRFSRIPSGMHERHVMVTTISTNQTPTSWIINKHSWVCTYHHRKITKNSETRGVVTVSNKARQYYARVQNACLQVVGRQGAFQNIENFLLSPNILFKNIFESIYSFKNSTKKLSGFFLNNS